MLQPPVTQGDAERATGAIAFDDGAAAGSDSRATPPASGTIVPDTPGQNNQSKSGEEPSPTGTGESARTPSFVTDLTGDLPCVGCGYNLRGLSIRAVCSECGTPVRATILAQVDPLAEQLQPIRRPKLVAGGLIVWSWGAVLAAVAIWALRLTEVSDKLLGVRFDLGPLRDVAVFGLVCSMLGAVVLIRPTARVMPWESYKAVGGVLAFIPLIYIHHWLQTGYDGAHGMGPPYVGGQVLDPVRSGLRLTEGLLIILAIMGVRGNAVALAERSLVMRTGRVDTQPLIALVWSIALAMSGDLLFLAIGTGNGPVLGVIETLSLVMIAVGSFLFTLGLFGVGFDTIRLRSVILQPAPGLSDIFRDEGP